jgi:hypothetical protein
VLLDISLFADGVKLHPPPKPRITVKAICEFARSSNATVSREAKKLGFTAPFSRWQAKMLLERIYRVQGRVLAQGLVSRHDHDIPRLGVLKRG